MRPIRLRMKAFISYRDEQTIDFTRFTDGLFLVEGDIGAGKTTIFDAISFALFGEASGDGRKTDDLHCNLVSKGTDTEVELTFSQSGNEYRVERKIRYTLTRGTTDDYKDPKQNVVLYLPDGGTVKDQKNVNKKIEEIIGLNKEQFEKIVMLAQGEFRKFLEASSDEKAVILKKLIDVTEYVRYQEILSESHKKLKALRESNDTAVKNHMETAFVFPDEESAESGLYLYNNPELLKNLLELKEADEAAVTALKAEHDKKINIVTGLTAKKAKAESDNQNIADLSESMDHLKELKSKAQEMETLKCRLDSVSVVVNKICHVIEESKEQEKKDKALDEDITKLGANIEKLGEDLESASLEVKNDEIVIKEIEKIKADAAAKTALLPKYDEHQELAAKIITKEKEIDFNSKALENAQLKLKELEEQEIKARAEKDAITDPSGEMNKAQNALDETGRKRKSFDELSKLYRKLEGDDAKLKKKESELSSLMESSNDKKRAYDEKYSIFMNGQAALLADRLGKKIEDSGEADCPVCGTHFVRGQAHNFAKGEGVLVTEDDVNSARSEADNAYNAFIAFKNDYDSDKAVFATNKESAFKKAQELFDDCHTPDDLNSGYLDAKEKLLDEECNACKEALEKARKALERFNELDAEITKLKEDISKLQNDATTYGTTVENVSKELEGLKEQESALKSGLEFDSKDKAEAEIKELEAKALAMQKTVDEHKAHFDRINNQLTAKQTSLAEKNSQKTALAEEAAKTAKALNEVLTANSFSTPNDALAIIEGINDPDAWIKKTTKEIYDYNNDVTNTGNRISELEEKTKGLETVDIEALSESIAKAAAERDECNDRLNKRTSLLDNHKAAYNVVKDNREKNAGTERAWAVLNRLAPMAAGSSSDNGRISFDRYILGAFFAELLDKANRKLIELTGGRYQLNHKTTAERANSVAGLDVEIINMSEASVISKGSLSGGEKFLTSLSLALGLSELAQDHFGGQTLDSLFIDEGFGTLDDKSLSLTMNVLNNLTGNNSRLVGIISHVDVSDYPIPHKIHVEKRGSASVITKQG